ncbi:MAG: S24 family peptidase [Bacteroidetes bacterium]|nr:MAG: S24 family peptidase [Bacteroidota bacterium]
MGITQRIGQIIDKEGISPGRLEKVIGASKGVISRSIRQDTDIQSKWLTKVVENYPHYNAYWILTGDGEMLSRAAKTTIHHKGKTDRAIDEQSVPLYDYYATAGVVSLFSDTNSEDVIDTIRIPNLPKCDGAIYVTGDSMYPILKSGDIVIYKKINDLRVEIFWGEMYLVSINVAGDDYISVKYVQRSEIDDNHIRLVSHNQHHQPKEVNIKDVTSMAMVKASIRMQSML